jgi:hypothetical protein
MRISFILSSLLWLISVPAVADPATGHVVAVIDPSRATIVHRLPAPDTINTGRIDKQALIASVPFAYNRPITLAADYKAVVTGKIILKGTRGFDAGFFKTNLRPMPVHVYCLFGDPAVFSGPDTYAREPLCYIPDFTAFFGTTQAGELQIRSYIPTSFSGNPIPIRVPPVTEDGTPIDHDFHIDISFKRWTRDQGRLGIVVYLKTEGHIIEENFMPADDDNILRLDLGDGILKLRIDPSDSDHVYSEFDKAAA